MPRARPARTRSIRATGSSRRTPSSRRPSRRRGSRGSAHRPHALRLGGDKIAREADRPRRRRARAPRRRRRRRSGSRSSSRRLREAAGGECVWSARRRSSTRRWRRRSARPRRAFGDGTRLLRAVPRASAPRRGAAPRRRARQRRARSASATARSSGATRRCSRRLRRRASTPSSARRSARGRGRLRRRRSATGRRHGRVPPRRRRQFYFLEMNAPHPGRAPGDRARDGFSPRAGADSRRRGPAARREGRSCCKVTRSEARSTPRIRATSCAERDVSRRPGARALTRAFRRVTRLGLVMIGEADRPRADPRLRPSPAWPTPPRRGRGRDDEPALPARPSVPGLRGRGRTTAFLTEHPLGSPAPPEPARRLASQFSLSPPGGGAGARTLPHAHEGCRRRKQPDGADAGHRHPRARQERVAARQHLLVLEAMKMETPRRRPTTNRGRQLPRRGDRVAGGALLVELENSTQRYSAGRTRRPPPGRTVRSAASTTAAAVTTKYSVSERRLDRHVGKMIRNSSTQVEARARTRMCRNRA